MEYTMNQKLQLGAIALLYIILGVVGVYAQSLIFLFPVLATPLTLYLLRHEMASKLHIGIQVGIILAILVTTGEITQVLLYSIAVVLPSYLFVACYKRNSSLPHTMFYIGLTVVGIFYVYIIAMKAVGIDYIQYYFAALDQYASMYLLMVEEVAQGMTQEEIREVIPMFKQLINAQITVLKTIYPGLLLVVGVGLAGLHIIIVGLIGRMRKWKMPSLKQFGQFTFQKKLLLLLLLSILMVQGAETNEVMQLMGMNLYFFISALLEGLGCVTLLVLVSRRQTTAFLKGLLIVSIGGLVMTMPLVLGIVGMMDILFDFRKNKISI